MNGGTHPHTHTHTIEMRRMRDRKTNYLQLDTCFSNCYGICYNEAEWKAREAQQERAKNSNFPYTKCVRQSISATLFWIKRKCSCNCWMLNFVRIYGYLPFFPHLGLIILPWFMTNDLWQSDVAVFSCRQLSFIYIFERSTTRTAAAAVDDIEGWLDSVQQYTSYITHLLDANRSDWIACLERFAEGDKMK